jgi:nitrogen regulatory protein P-II 1
MKKIEAIVKPFKLEEIAAALTELHVGGMTVSEVRGIGRPDTHTEMYHGNAYTVDFLPKFKVEIVVSDGLVPEAMTAILKAAKTGKMGDGKLFVSSVENAISIRTEEAGDQAVSG